MTDRTGTRSASPDARAAALTGPVRTCIGCRGTDSWSALLRVVAGSATVATSDGVSRGSAVPVIVDAEHRLGGRGAWLHPTVACCDHAVRRRAFGRALRVSTAIEVTGVTAYVCGLSHTEIDRPKGTESGFDADERPMSTQQ